MVSSVRFRDAEPIYPCVAQPGRAPGLGPGGRMFESCHTDHILAFVDGVEKDKLSTIWGIS